MFKKNIFNNENRARKRAQKRALHDSHSQRQIQQEISAPAKVQRKATGRP